MSIIINTNISSMQGIAALNKNTAAMNKALERLSTGCRINSVKDDAAGSAISTSLNKEISSLTVAQGNAQMGQSILDTANGALSNIKNMLQRIRDLAEQSANGSLGDDERTAMQNEVTNLTTEINRTKSATEFNGMSLLHGYEGDIEVPLTEEEILAARIERAESLGYTAVTTAQQLKDAFVLNDKTCKVMLCKDIDLSELGENWTAVGTNADRFKGTFDGNGFTISNLTINEPSYDKHGLFGYADGATIRNVALENVNVKGNQYMGGLVGCAGNTKIENCTSTGTVTGCSDVGGLVGAAYGNTTIENSSSSGSVTGRSNIGGLVGENTDNSTITNCSASVEVTGNNYTGGLVGYVNASTIENCTSTGTVSGNSKVGGLVGSAYSSNTSIKNSKTTSSVSGTDEAYTGAVVGYYSVGTGSGNEYNSTVNGEMRAVGKINGTRDPGISDNRSLVIDPSYVPEGAGTIPYVDPTTKIVHISEPKSSFNLQVGTGDGNDMVITIETGYVMGPLSFDITTAENAQTALAQIDSTMSAITEKMTELGAMSSRLDSAMQYQTIQKDSKISTQSIIKDADFAAESSNYIKQQILQQTTSSLLSTANQNPNIALMLLNMNR